MAHVGPEPGHRPLPGPRPPGVRRRPRRQPGRGPPDVPADVGQVAPQHDRRARRHRWCLPAVDGMDRDLVVEAGGGAGQREFLGPGEGPIPVDLHRPGHDVTIERYFTPEAIRLGLTGFAAGAALGLAWRAAGRRRWGAAPFVLAVFGAARYAGRSDWPRWGGMVAAGVGVTVLAGLGSRRLLAVPAVGWQWTAAGSLVSTAGVWAG